MTPLTQQLKRAIRVIRPGIVQDAERVVRALARNAATRRVANEVYTRLSLAQQEALWARFSTSFRDTDAQLSPGVWRIVFAGRSIELPLGAAEPRLEWVHALSALGHEIAIKRSYEVLVRAPERPRVFFDIGANYGLHSILMASHGIQTVAFEPNPACHAYFARAVACNRLDCKLEQLALDDRDGTRRLVFPSAATWLGTLESEVAAGLDQASLQQIDVTTTTVDHYVRDHRLEPALMKIDTEGNERRVLAGARQTLDSLRPLILFESWQDASQRNALFDLLLDARYAVGELPLPTRAQLTREAFLACHEANFIAAPVESWGRTSFL